MYIAAVYSRGLYSRGLYVINRGLQASREVAPLSVVLRILSSTHNNKMSFSKHHTPRL